MYNNNKPSVCQLNWSRNCSVKRRMDVPKFVPAGWVKQELEKPDCKLKIVDATWHNPVWKRDATAEHESCRIKGAVFMDMRVIRDTESDWPNTLPSKEHFENCISKLGISNDSAIVLYDNNEKFGMYSAARAWLLLKLFGHNHVAIIDGGLPAYLKCGGPTESDPPATPQPTAYKADFIKSDLTRSYEQMLFNWNEKLEQVVDGRPAGRFEGTSPEPNPNLPSGHMTGAFNTPFTDFINADSKTMKSADKLREVFQQAGVNLDKPMVAMCGSGMTACWVIVAGLLCGVKTIPLYDVSTCQLL